MEDLSAWSEGEGTPPPPGTGPATQKAATALMLRVKKYLPQGSSFQASRSEISCGEEGGMQGMASVGELEEGSRRRGRGKKRLGV